MEISNDFSRGTAPDAPDGPTFGLLPAFQTALTHEMPNLLVPLQGYARMLLEAGLDESATAMAQRIAELVQRADALVRRLADVGRLCRAIESGADGPRGLELREVVEEARAAVGFQFPGRAVAWCVPANLPYLPVSRNAAFPVLVQLLARALRGAAEKAVRIEVVGAGSRFSIHDDGPALSAEQADVLFDPFRSPEGGLFLVRQVVARWKGTLRVVSKAGQGTTVSIGVGVRG